MRWRTRGDVDALTRVFDAQAPGLLRFGVHLVGDTNAAEDLVQETFLTALRRASEYDASRPIDRWLAGILVRHAQEMRREARSFPAHALPERIDEDTPFEAASRRELSSELSRAVDALEEPYRAAILLHLKHGLEPADIAHVLGRSPGAVRVQLFRAREMLRKSLPAGIASALVIFTESARGLDAVRETVLHDAARLAPAASVSGGILGGGIVMKKLVVALAILLIGLAVYLGVARPWATTPAPSMGGKELVELRTSPIASESSSLATPEAVVEVSRSAVQTAPKPHRFLGRVLSTPDDTPVVGATVDLYAGRNCSRAEFDAHWASRSQQTYNGWVSPATIQRKEMHCSLFQLADLEPLRDYVAPSAGDVPIASTTTDKDGQFDLPSASDDGLIVVHAVGFGERRHVWLPRKMAEDEVRNVYVSRAGHLNARLITEDGTPYPHRVALALRGAVRFVLEVPKPNMREETHFDIWDVETDEQGRFSVDVAAQAVFVTSRDPSIGVREYGWALPDGRGCAPRGWLSPGRETADVVIVVRPTCVLDVSDARTGKPIERFHIQAKPNGANRRGSAGMNGWFSAPQGVLRITPEMDHFVDVVEREAQDGAWSARVWAVGYTPTEVKVDSAWKAQRVAVRLEPGSVSSLSGRVMRGSQPAAGVGIVIHADIGKQWTPPVDESNLIWLPVAGSRSDAAGDFEIALLPGRHLATFGEGAERISIPFDVPSANVTVDLAATARLRVRVVLSDGAPAIGRPIELRRPDDGRIVGVTDDHGEFLVDRTCVGEHVVRASSVKSLDQLNWDVESKIVTRATEEVALDLVLQPDQPRYGRLVLVGTTNPEQWKVNVRGWTETRVSVERDGRIPIDLRKAGNLEVFGPDGFEIVLNVPKDARDGHEFTVEVGERGYEGTLTSIADGKPISRVHVYAYLREPNKGKGMHAATTDAAGHFRIVGLEDAPYRLVFDEHFGAGASFANYVIHPTEVPTDPPRRLDLALPTRRGDRYEGAETIHIVGQLRWNGQVVEGSQAQFSADLAVAGAQLMVTQFMTLGPEGRYDASLPRSSRYTAWFWQPSTNAKGSVEWVGSGGAIEAHDVELH